MNLAPVAILALSTMGGDVPSKAAPAERVSAEKCPQLFGNDQTHTANRRYRKSRFHDLRIDDDRVEITHSVGAWKAPNRLNNDGLELLGVSQTSGGRVALLEVDKEASGTCPAGVYEVQVDDALGRGASVLAVDARGILLETRGELALLPNTKAPPPSTTRMIWRSHYEMVMDVKAKKGKSGRSSKRSKKKSKKKPKKKPAKRSKKR